MSGKPNVLLLIIDQFRADLLDGALARVANLKNLSALSRECATFRRHYTVTTPCGPSRVSLLTGQYAMNHRATRNGTPLRHDTPNLASQMRLAGYDPLLFGYTDTAQDPRVLQPDDPRLLSYEELMPGFTEVVRMRQESDDTAWRDYLRAKGYGVPKGNALYIPNGNHPGAPAIYRAEDSDTAFLTDRFLEHMGKAPPGWFATLTYIRPHPPFVAPAPYNAAYDPADLPPPAPAQPDEHPYMRAYRETKPARDTVQGFPDLAGTDEDVQQLRATYLGLAAEVDHHVGRVIDWLKSSGQWDDTILVVTADHGEMLGDLGCWGKGTWQDGSLHVPLMIRVPGQAPNLIEGMTESIDVSPTILDLVGGQIPDSMDGQSLVPIIRTGAGGKPITFSEHEFGDPISPSQIQRELGLDDTESSFAVLRTETHRLVHFAGGLSQVISAAPDALQRDEILKSPDEQAICLDLSRKMLCHRMIHAEGTFSKTMVVDGGVKRAVS